MKLFEPFTVRGLTFKNRVVMPPMDLHFGLRNKKARAYYAERARGGVGAVITAAIPVDIACSDEAWGQEGALDSFLQGLRQLTDEVHAAGAAIGQQIWHGNHFPQGMGIADTRGEAVAPSPRDDLRELTREEIRSIVEKFGAAAANCKRAGFDFVDLHGAHAYLLCQFFSPLANRRTDEYGGDLQRRMRLGVECTRAVREAVGPGYPVFFRMGARELDPGGITIEDSVVYAGELARAGADVIDVSVADKQPHPFPTRRDPMATFAPLAEAIRRGAGVPVVAVGRMNTAEVAERVLSQGQADLVAVGRQLIADPFWARKIQEGRDREIVACDSCNVNCCRYTLPRKLPPDAPMCKYNDRVGREWETPAPE